MTGSRSLLDIGIVFLIATSIKAIEYISLLPSGGASHCLLGASSDRKLEPNSHLHLIRTLINSGMIT
jgi:hypothetical protein